MTYHEVLIITEDWTHVSCISRRISFRTSFAGVKEAYHFSDNPKAAMESFVESQIDIQWFSKFVRWCCVEEDAECFSENFDSQGAPWLDHLFDCSIQYTHFIAWRINVSNDECCPVKDQSYPHCRRLDDMDARFWWIEKISRFLHVQIQWHHIVDACREVGNNRRC